MDGGGPNRALVAVVSVAVTLALGGAAMIAPRLGHGVEACASPPESSYGDAGGGPRAPAYAIGSTIHDGDRTLDAGGPVLSFVRTDRGFVAIVGENGRSVHRDGEPAEVVLVSGRDVRHLADAFSGSAELHADDTGSLVAFYEDDELVVVDLAQGDERVLRWGATSPFDSSGAPMLLALDDGKVYVDDDGAVRPLDLTSCETVSLPVEASGVEDVAGEVVAEHDGSGSAPATRVRRLSAEEGRVIEGADEPVLSPDGEYVAVRVRPARGSVKDGRIIEVATGVDVTPESDYRWHWFFQWLDERHVVGFASTRAPLDPLDGNEVDVIACTIGTGRCRVVGHETLRIDRFAVPTGVGSRFGAE